MRLVAKIFSVLGIFIVAGAGAVFAEDAAATGMSASSAEIAKWLALSSAVSLGIAALGCGLAQGKMVSSAMEGISRNPQAAKDMFVPMILGLAFIEALTIYALIFVFIFKAAIPF